MEMTDDLEKRKEIIHEVVKATLRPELYNRISQVATATTNTCITIAVTTVPSQPSKKRRLIGNK